MLTLHAAGGVAGARGGGRCRCASSATTCVHAPRPWTTSPAFPGLADELPAGAPMDHPLFPVALGALAGAEWQTASMLLPSWSSTNAP